MGGWGGGEVIACGLVGRGVGRGGGGGTGMRVRACLAPSAYVYCSEWWACVPVGEREVCVLYVSGSQSFSEWCVRAQQPA
jgi:hypothetical protein